jgi:hypothetical protein
MPQQTNRIPNGFLDLIGAETGGKTPPFYADNLAPSVDMTELYLGQTLATATQLIDHTAVQDSETVSVPVDEAWLLRGASASELQAATGLISAWSLSLLHCPRRTDATEISDPQYQIWKFALTLDPNAAGATNIASEGMLFPEPILVLPGTQILWTLRERDAGAQRTSALSLLMNVLR